MNRNQNVYRMVMGALLCAVGILIPMTFPKISIPPMSFTLASHVPIFLAAFLSPVIALVVVAGTTFGFFMVLPLPIVLRAASHVVWALVAALWIKKQPDTLYHTAKSILFCVVISLIHAACEVLVLIPLYFGGSLSAAVYQSGFFKYIVLLVGLGTFVHSSIDYTIAILVWRPLRHVNGIASIASAK